MARIRKTKAAPRPIKESVRRRIDAAFDDAATPISERVSSQSASERPSARKKRRLVVPDDEEEGEDGDDAVDFEMVVDVSTTREQDAAIAGLPQPIGAAQGGFMPEDTGGGFIADDGADSGGGFVQADSGGGGFPPEDTGGGFLPEASASGGGGFLTNDGGGGFILDDLLEAQGGYMPPEPTGGGFLLDDAYNGDNATGNGNGGFVLQDGSLGGVGGGFMPGDDEAFSSEPHLFDQLPDLPQPVIPTSPRKRNRIPLHAIPAALDALDLPSDSHDLLSLFRDIASDDDEAGESVPRHRFVEACEALIGDDEGNTAEEAEEGEDPVEEPTSDEDEEDSYVENVPKPRKGAPPRRSTRGQADPKPTEVDLDAIDNVSDLSDLTSSSDEAGVSNSAKKATKLPFSKGKGTKKGKGKQRGDRDRMLSAEELQEARDTFELFFEGSEMGRAKKPVIRIDELRHIVHLLGEKMEDDDLQEMLDYAGRSAGPVVDFEAFSKILAEAM